MWSVELTRAGAVSKWVKRDDVVELLAALEKCNAQLIAADEVLAQAKDELLQAVAVQRNLNAVVDPFRQAVGVASLDAAANSAAAATSD